MDDPDPPAAALMVTVPIAAELVWVEQLWFAATTGDKALVVDGDANAGPSPMQLLAVGLAGCMGADVVAILRKGRQPLAGLRISCSSVRVAEPPRRFSAVSLHFHVTGAVPDDAVRRAIELSHDKYCSVWHSMRPDIALTTAYSILAEPDAA